MASVLLIEDEIQLATVISRALRQSGHRVRHALDGRNVEHVVTEERFDVIITDMTMPERDGLEVICGLRRAGVQVPIIAMSGAPYAMMFGRIAQQAVATVFLPKPFSLDDLTVAVEQALRSSEGRVLTAVAA